MKRNTLIAVGIVVVLGALYLITSSSPRQTARSPMTVEKVEGLNRIVIEPPAGNASSADAGSDEQADSKKPGEKVVLEKRDDGWWLAKPVESPASSSVASTIDDLFGEAIGTDDLKVSGDRSEYGLGASGVTLSLFGGDGDDPDVRLVVGDQTDVSGSGVERTYVRKPDSSEMHRAQAALGDFVRQSVDEFRSDKIVEIDKKTLTRLEWRRGGETADIVLERDNSDEDWTLVQPQVDWSLDTGAVGNITGALSGLTADGFADDKSKSDIGLDAPAARLTYTTNTENGGGETTLLVGKTGEEGDASYYAKRADKPFLYEISSYAGEKLTATLDALRSKTPKTFDKKAITEVRFPGEAGVVVRKEDGSWSLVEPEADKSLNESKLDRKLSKIAELSVSGFPEVEASDAGLAVGADRLEFQMEDGTGHAISFGDAVDDGDGNERYVKFSDGDEIFTVTKFNYDALRPAVDDLVGKSQKGRGKGMPRGKGMGRGMKKKLQQMRMKKMLQRKLKKKRGR